MAHLTSKVIDKKTLLDAVRTGVTAGSGARLSQTKFMATSGIKISDIRQLYPTWDQVLRAAGFDFEPYKQRIEPERLLKDWGSVVRKLKKLPSIYDYRDHGQFDVTTFVARFGTWTKVPGAFHAFAARRPDWKDVFAMLPASCQPIPIPVSKQRNQRQARVQCRRERIPRRISKTRPLKESTRSNGRAICGVPLQFPDCEAKRRVGPDAWQGVNIEFEYESRNFRTHGHQPEACDIIVCWTHNWPDCPKTLEVIELSEEIKRLVPAE